MYTHEHSSPFNINGESEISTGDQGLPASQVLFDPVPGRGWGDGRILINCYLQEETPDSVSGVFSGLLLLAFLFLLILLIFLILLLTVFLRHACLHIFSKQGSPDNVDVQIIN